MQGNIRVQDIGLAFAVKGNQIAVRVGKGKGPPEGAINGCGSNLYASCSKLVMDFLRIRGIEPQSNTESRLSA